MEEKTEVCPQCGQTLHENQEEKKRSDLYSQFKQTNWWASHPYAWMWACAAYFCILMALVVTGVSPQIGLMATFGFLLFLPLIAIIKHFVHDRPRNKYMNESSPKDAWSDVGGILKTYD